MGIGFVSRKYRDGLFFLLLFLASHSFTVLRCFLDPFFLFRPTLLPTKMKSKIELRFPENKQTQ